MFVASKNKREVYQSEQIINIYIGSDGKSIKTAAGPATRGGVLGQYATCEEAEAAMEILLIKLNSNEKVIYMPSDEETRHQTRRNESPHRNIAGKKTKGHGGS